MSTNTREIFVDTYLELIKEKEITKISIIDLTEKSQSSRQTFYYYFKNIDDLIKWAFENETEKACNKLVSGESWPVASKYYIELTEKFSYMIRCAKDTTKGAYIYGLLSKSVEKFIRDYVRIATGNEERVTEFFYSACKYLVVGLIIEECQKENPDYNCIIEFVKQGLIKDNK